MKMLAYLAHGLAAALLLTSGPVAARPAPPATNVATPALWRVRDAGTTLYLFGTVHVMKPGVDWFRGGVKAAFDGSDELVLEIIEPDDPNVMGGVMMSRWLRTHVARCTGARHVGEQERGGDNGSEKL